MVIGTTIELDSRPSLLKSNKQQFSRKDSQIISDEIETLTNKVVLKIATHNPGQIISPIFLVPKPDQTFRMILNLKEFKHHVLFDNFRMDT